MNDAGGHISKLKKVTANIVSKVNHIMSIAIYYSPYICNNIRIPYITISVYLRALMHLNAGDSLVYCV